MPTRSSPRPPEARRAAGASGARRLLRALPPVNALLDSAPVAELLAAHPRPLVVAAVADTLEAARRSIREGGGAALEVSFEALAQRAAEGVRERLRPRLRRVINATGVVLHTNLGRSPLADDALAQIQAVAARYSNLELDLATGERGSRHAHVEELLCRLTSAEAGMVVNNNAAAVLLMLSALAAGGEVIVSRGELVEIGGSFRVPDVMVQGGAQLVEVGTTNKTHLRDYERACGERTAALLKVHTSNFRIVGFTEQPPLAELAALARERRVPLLVDWGSGVMVDLARLGIAHEETVDELLSAGADLVTFSGDKLLGGPQGGFLVGRRDLVERCRGHALARALRVDKLTLAGIEATLKLYLDPERALERIPTLRMLAATKESLRPRAHALAARLAGALPEALLEVFEGHSQAGGGALPGTELPSVLVGVACERPAHEVEARLRAQDPAVLARVQRGLIVFDVRTLWPDEIDLVVAALRRAAARDEPA